VAHHQEHTARRECGRSAVQHAVQVRLAKLQVSHEHKLESARFRLILAQISVHPIDGRAAGLGQAPALLQADGGEVHRRHLPATVS
jgi:hypothetical protein